MKRLSLLALAVLAAGAVQAAPKAESALECGIAADMALVAHSLAKEDIQRPKADSIMARIYDVGESQRGKEMMKQIVDAAYVVGASAAQGGRAQSGQKFAEELYATCMKSGGNMDPVLGKQS